MTPEQVQVSLNNNKLQLSFWGKFSHFSIVIISVTIPCMSIIFSLTDLEKPIKNAEIFLVFIFLILSVALYKLQSARLMFKEIHTTLSRQQLNEIIEKIGNELKWSFEEMGYNFIVARTHPSFLSGSWGEQITIIFDNNRVLVNSICDPQQPSSIVSMGRNSQNEDELIKEIQNACR